MTEHLCKICGKPARRNKYGTWRATCGSEECLYQSHLQAQATAARNRPKIVIPKEELYELFIVQNKPRYELAKKYGCSETNIKKWLRIYGIAKDQKDALKNTRSTKVERYGNPTYNNPEKTEQTCLEKYGVRTNLQMLTEDNYKAISKKETDWLDGLNVPVRQHIIQIGYKTFHVDGYDDKTNTLYEFLGDYWHGNPSVFDHNRLNERVNKTFGELYDETMERFEMFKKLGYNIVYRWETGDSDIVYNSDNVKKPLS